MVRIMGARKSFKAEWLCDFSLFGCHFLENGQQRVRPEAGDPFKMLFRWPERKMMQTCTRIGVLDGYGGLRSFRNCIGVRLDMGERKRGQNL